MEVHYRDMIKMAEFKNVFGPTDDQDKVCSKFKHIISNLMKGISCCIMAYGCTGSGKTYTMYGPEWSKIFSSKKQFIERVNHFLQECKESDSFMQNAGIILNLGSSLLEAVAAS